MSRYNKLIKILSYSFLVFLFISCQEDDNQYIEAQKEKNEAINTWIYKVMSFYYYWNDHLPDLQSNKNQIPSEYFKSILSSNDKFSQILNSKEDHLNMLHGTKQSCGFEYLLGYADENKFSLIGIVLYVYPDSMSDKNGIVRGDKFTDINGSSLNINNYKELLDLDGADYTFIKNDNNTSIKHVRKASLNINPILNYQIHSIDNHVIGYICYNQFISDNGDGSQIYKKSLLNTFKYFKDENINELVLDFRYNPGGLIDLSVLISSLVVPNIDTTNTAIITKYNSKLNPIYEQQNKINIKFEYYPESYVGNNLKRIFVLTGNGTASASEAVINSLLPYIDVIKIGEKTYGKNYGSEMFTEVQNPENIWVLQPIVLKLYNANGKSDYADGFVPDHEVNEFNYPLIDLGNQNEPLLNKAISIIQGKNSQYNVLKHNKNHILPFNYSLEKEIHSLPIFINDKSAIK